MRQIWWKISEHRALRCVRAPLLCLTMIAATGVSISPVHAGNASSRLEQAQVLDDHVVPAGQKALDHKAVLACSPGIGCIAVTLPAHPAIARVAAAEAVAGADVAQLASRTIAPPLPPPKSFILV